MKQLFLLSAVFTGTASCCVHCSLRKASLRVVDSGVLRGKLWLELGTPSLVSESGSRGGWTPSLVTLWNRSAVVSFVVTLETTVP